MVMPTSLRSTLTDSGEDHMDDLIKLKIELESVRRAYWQAQQHIAQLLIDRSLSAEENLRSQLESPDQKKSESSQNIRAVSRSD